MVDGAGPQEADAATARARRRASCACASHGASVTAGVRRDIQSDGGEAEEHAPEDRRPRRRSRRRRAIARHGIAAPPVVVIGVAAPRAWGAEPALMLISWLPPSRGRSCGAAARSVPPKVRSHTFDTGASAARARSAVPIAAARPTGPARRARSDRPSVHTKWRADADARRSDAATSAVTGQDHGRLGDGVEDEGQRQEGHGLGSALSRRVDHAARGDPAPRAKSASTGRRAAPKSPVRPIRRRRSAGCGAAPTAGRCRARRSAGRRSAGRPVRAGRALFPRESASSARTAE